jgi:hypothetical protein
VQSLAPREGPVTGTRLLDVRMWDGVQAQILPDRAFDIGACWYRGVPVSWSSRLGDRRALSTPLSGTDWITAFSGGLITTCGLFNVGAPSEEEPQHGNVSHLAADEVDVRRTVDASGEVTVEASAVLRDGSALGPLLELRRQWSFRTGAGVIELRDDVTNLGDEPVPAPILYHINLGFPLWRPGAWLEGPGGDVVARDEDARVGLATWNRAPELVPHAREWSFEHVLPTADRDGWATVSIHSPQTDLLGTISWDTSTLPRMHQWVHPATTINALGIEPSNCSVRGRAADREEGRLPTLDPEQSRVTRLRISFSPYS